MNNKFFYKVGNKTKVINLPIGRFSSIRRVEVEIIDSPTKPNNLNLEDVCFVASSAGNERRIFFSSRSSLIYYNLNINDKKFNFVEIKGGGKPNFGISPTEYFLEDGRDKDKVHDPIGGYSLEKAILEWESLKKLNQGGVKTQIPLYLLRLKEIKGPKNEDLALVIRTSDSNIRLGHFENNPSKIKSILGLDYEPIVEEVLHNVGANLRKLHNIGLCHNALHEENITLNGEIVDLEYLSKANKELIYRDLWYSLLSFAEVFGTPLGLELFIEAYTGKRRRVVSIVGNEIKKMEEEAKAIARELA